MGLYLGMELLNHLAVLLFEELPNFSISANHFMYLPAMQEGSDFSTFSLTVFNFFFVDNSHPTGLK